MEQEIRDTILPPDNKICSRVLFCYLQQQENVAENQPKTSESVIEI